MSLINLERPETDELQYLRAGVRRFDAVHKLGLFDALNALLTIKRTAADLEAQIDAACRQVDLSAGRLNVLMVLNAAPGKTMALSEVGKHLVVTRPNVTGLVDGLVRDGFVRRIDHPDDRRMILAQLTEQAQKFLQRFVPQHARNVKAIMSCLSVSEQRQVAELLDKLRAHIKTLSLPKYEM
jgi:DNA-binding MarR family transcriptional regulator